MKKRYLISALLMVCPLLMTALAVAALLAQDIKDTIVSNGGKPALAVVDFRGADAAQPLMSAFNSTLYGDLQNSALFDLRPKSMFPLNNPQQPADLRPEDAGQGYALKDWAGAPVNASHLVFGYSAVTNGVLAVYGNVYATREQNLQSAQLFARTYAGSPDEAGAIYLAHQFATDIITRFGGSGSLLNSRIYFISTRGAAGKFGSEIWAMDWDGNNQKQLTHLGGQLGYPAISSDGSRLAVTFWPLAGGQPRINMVNSQTGRTLPFYNQNASLNAAAAFTPDGTELLRFTRLRLTARASRASQAPAAIPASRK
jgi:TolB protein